MEGARMDMATWIIEGYIINGWDDQHILRSLRMDRYRFLHELYLERGRTFMLELMKKARVGLGYE